MPEPFPFLLNPESLDERWMAEALRQAWSAFQQGEVPIGAVVVHEEQLIARGHNQVEMLKDATAHAEMLTLTQASAHLENWRLKECTLYTTIEPCAMCTGAMFLSRLKRVVWGAPDLRHGAGGSWVNLFEADHPIHTLERSSGVYAAESAQLMRQFFQKRRAEADG